MYDVLYCIDCHCAKYHVHAKYCGCQACAERFCGKDSGEQYVERVADEPAAFFFEPY